MNENIEINSLETHAIGTSIQSFNIIETIAHPGGYKVRLAIDLDSGYELEDVTMNISFEDLAGY